MDKCGLVQCEVRTRKMSSSCQLLPKRNSRESHAETMFVSQVVEPLTAPVTKFTLSMIPAKEPTSHVFQMSLKHLDVDSRRQAFEPSLTTQFPPIVTDGNSVYPWHLKSNTSRSKFAEPFIVQKKTAWALFQGLSTGSTSYVERPLHSESRQV